MSEGGFSGFLKNMSMFLRQTLADHALSCPHSELSSCRRTRVGWRKKIFVGIADVQGSFLKTKSEMKWSLEATVV